MSSTTIYCLGAVPGEVAEFGNAWRAGMYVWNDIARRYFGFDGFPMFDMAKQHSVWNAANTGALPQHEAIVLLSTMDRATVRTEEKAALVEAFRRYGAEHPRSSYAEQAGAIETADLPPGHWLAWRQTSVAEFWGKSWDDEREERDWYDPRTGRDHFDVIAEAKACTIEEAGL